MDITKSQSDFEAWVVTWWPQSKTMIAEKFDDGGYWNMPLQQYFEAWKAARESIEVDIPEEMTCREALEQGHTSDYANGFTAAIIQCYSVVRTAGIRIKGESEKC
ncbi:hypothetical protein [Yersinia massiliensis]|uniref:hypothetical protein n=1 Tax=Yersinia massiliensis TaxID=419257 RepID=UPI0005B6535E|nr:hypothetical protein [Yersinia massiliensis]